MNQKHLNRLLSVMLVVALLCGLAVPAAAAGNQNRVNFTKVDNSAVSAQLSNQEELKETEEKSLYADTDTVRVSIVLEDASTIAAGYATAGIADNKAAMAYRADLQANQKSVEKAIAKATGEELDVVWNMTLAANMISANVKFGKIAEIEKVPGVAEVIVETRYEPAVYSVGGDKPNMTVSSQMTGANTAWQSGYTGAGTRIAIIDTGLDTDHQSFNNDAFKYALAEDAKAAGMTYDEYVAKKDLLDAAEIASVLEKLNAYSMNNTITAEDLYRNEKVAYGFSYIDRDLDVTHLNDTQGEHGSHVAGISTANRFLKKGEEFVSAASEVGVVGNAPDAQILVMKVFGNRGGAYDSDYMVAIEDAILLGADSVNLSLGSGNPGYTYSTEYQEILDALTETDTVVTISAGNSGAWADNAMHEAPGYVYAEDVAWHTGGSPGTYTNSLGVASVDNDGAFGSYIKAGETSIVYNETTGYKNSPLAGLDTSADLTGTEYDFVLTDGVGAPADYADIDLTGKIVLCSRGEISFYEKGDNAANLGAAATIIYNNQPGVISMDLSDYKNTAPCVSITQAEGAAVKAIATEQTTEAGLKYYTGKLTVVGGKTTLYKGSKLLTMSDFSSWGVPGDLSMKPEITAPGGMIYSLNGTHKTSSGMVGGTDQYESMSGTSMAAPQVAGIAALVKQYIEENNLSQENLTDRALAQSLMMSTAKPIFEDQDGKAGYVSILRQGSGLADASAATSAKSFILVDGQNDGKVKAEFGDDAKREGIYNFGFTLTNLTDEATDYNLYADLFTQGLFQHNANTWDDTMTLYQDTWTSYLDANVIFNVNGEDVDSSRDLTKFDFNGDGKTDKADAQLLMDNIVAGVALKANEENTDVNFDGYTDTYDVHYLLAMLSAKNAIINLPANGTVVVDVTIVLTEEQKAMLNEYYKAGAFVEGFVYASPVATAEGDLGTTHSIPVLGYYGNWTDASMFDVGTYATYATGEESKTPYLGNMKANAVGIVRGDDPESTYYFAGNPLVADETYMPERNAMNAQRGDKIAVWNYSVIRNAMASRVAVDNLTTGETLKEEFGKQAPSAYYHSNQQVWKDTNRSTQVPNVNLSGLEEGTKLQYSLALLPELYQKTRLVEVPSEDKDKDPTYVEETYLDWDALGEGAVWNVPVTIDNTAPTLDAVSYDMLSNTLKVTATDNQYIAAVALYNAGGTQVLSYQGSDANQKPGDTLDFELSLSGVNGQKFLLQVADYAMNVDTYEVNINLGEPAPMPSMLAFDTVNNAWVGFERDSDENTMQQIAASKKTFFAATDADGIVFASTNEGELYVMEENDISSMTYVTNMGVVLSDMAYDKSTETVYGVADGALVTVDKLTGEIAVVGEIGIDTNTLACDAEGNFYSAQYSTGYIYKYTVETLETPEQITSTRVNNAYVQAMEIDPNNGLLYWSSFYAMSFLGMTFMYAYLYEINVETGNMTRLGDFNTELTCLIIPVRKVAGDWNKPTTTVSGVEISASSIGLIRGSSASLTASVLPWTATDRTVTWTSSDESIATVDANGNVKAVEVGTAVITATSNLDPTKSASCTVNVDVISATVKGALLDEESVPKLFTWDMENDSKWTAGEKIEPMIESATYDPMNNTLYVMDSVEDNWGMYKIDATTGKTLETAGNSAKAPMWDMAYASYFSTKEAPVIGAIYGQFFLPNKNPMELDTAAFDLSTNFQKYTGASYAVAIADGGYEQVYDNEDQVNLDTEAYYILDDAGYIWVYNVFPVGDSFSAWLGHIPTDLNVKFTPNGEDMLCSMVFGDDGNLYLSRFTGSTSELYRLTYNAEAEMFNAMAIGDVGADVWPAALYEVTSNESAADKIPAGAMKADAVNVTTEEMLASTEKLTMNRALSAKELKNAVTGAEAEAILGSTNAVKDYASAKRDVEKVAPMAIGSASSAKDNALVEIISKTPVTNGLVTVEYDPAALTLVGYDSKMDIKTFAGEDGFVAIGYASKDAVAAGRALAELEFTFAENVKASEIVITVYEENMTYPNSVRTLELVKECGGVDCPSAKFTDVAADAWYHAAIDYVVSHGLMVGATETVFNTEGKLTRGQLMSILYRLAGAPEVEAEVAFTDVDADMYYAPAIAWAFENGIAYGVNATNFAPDAPVTREQTAAFLARYAQFAGVYEAPSAGALKGFADVQNITGYAVEYMAWAVENEIVHGSNGKLLPTDTTRRCEAAVMMANFCINF